MSTPPLNEDDAHIRRTPNKNLAANLGLLSPAGRPIKYSHDLNESVPAEPPLAVPPGTFRHAG